MKKFQCKICNYETDIKCNYHKHCTSKRHLKNQENSITNSKNSITNSKNYKCNHCNSEFKRIDNYNKHLNKCSNRLLNIIEEKEKEINALTNELNDALKLIQEYQLKVKDTEIRCLKEVNKININNNSHNRTNITQFIINKYPNAKNVWVPDEVSGLENYSSDKVEENVNKLITNIYKRNVEPEDRSIWCIDSSRNKYLTRLNNLWHVDLYGLLFCKKVCKQLSKRCNEYINEKENINIHDKMRVIAMIADLLLRKKLTGPIKGEFIVNTLEEAENEENE